jgi:aminopeptidase-like protein
LSGIAVATELARYLLRRENRLTYRFLFIPGTIGSLTWLSLNEDVVPRIAHGLVLSCVGDPGKFHYKRSRRGDAMIDRATAYILEQRKIPHAIADFSPFGYDERQYCSPGFDMPVGRFTRSPNGAFPEYHTSADNIGFVTSSALDESLRLVADILDLIERNLTYMRPDGRGEPHLGRHGLYPAIGGHISPADAQLSLLWVLNLADGRHSLLDMAERSEMSFDVIALAAAAAERANLIRRAGR